MPFKDAAREREYRKEQRQRPHVRDAQIERIKRWRVGHPERMHEFHVKSNLAEQLGCHVSDVPGDLVAAKAAVLRIKRELREAAKSDGIV